LIIPDHASGFPVLREFAAILKSDGIDGLIAALNRKAGILTGANRLGCLALDVLQKWEPHGVWPGHVEVPGDKCQYRGRQITDDRILDAVEIGPVRLPVIWVFVTLITSFGLNSTNL
jgi:hypothetical protein